MTNKNWRPDNWPATRRAIAQEPFQWSPSGLNLSAVEQEIESAVSKVLEAYWQSAEFSKDVLEKVQQVNEKEGSVGK